DWIEIHNPGNAPVNLDGHYLTDDATNLRKWRLPDTNLDPGDYLVVFASGKDRRDPAARLHADFSLSADGEFLALVASDGVTILSSFAPAFPPQFEDDSFGRGDSDPAWSYFSTPSPGAANGAGTRAGPIIAPVEKDPPRPVG